MGSVLLSIHRVQRELTAYSVDDSDNRGPLRISAPLSYIYLLHAAIKAQAWVTWLLGRDQSCARAVLLTAMHSALPSS
jgi:hypothetical protein